MSWNVLCIRVRVFMLRRSTSEEKSLIERPSPPLPEVVVVAAQEIVLWTFLEEFFPDAVMGSTVNIPPGATLEFNEAWLLRLTGATSVRNSVVAFSEPNGSGGGRIVHCMVLIWILAASRASVLDVWAFFSSKCLWNTFPQAGNSSPSSSGPQLCAPGSHSCKA